MSYQKRTTPTEPSKSATLRQRARWGDWRYNPNSFTLTYLPHGYEVNLEECTDSAHVLDWIAQIASKTWGTKAVGSFVLALNELLYLQHNVCGFGQNHQFDPTEWLKERRSQ